MEARSLDAIAPVGQDVKLSDGTTITVKPIKLGQLPRFVKAIRPIFGALVALTPDTSSPGVEGGQGAEPDADPAAVPDVDPAAIIELYADHGESIAEALAIVTGETRARLDALDLEEALALILALWEVNRDFFVHRLLPMLKRPQ